MHENCIGRIACVYKRGSLVYKLYQADSNIRILTDDREKLADTLAELVCLGQFKNNTNNERRVNNARVVSDSLNRDRPTHRCIRSNLYGFLCRKR